MLTMIRQKLKAFYKDDSGVVMLETVLVFPTQFLTMMIIIQVAHMFVAANVLQYATYQGTRTLLVNYKGSDTLSSATTRGEDAAWIIASAIDNDGGGSYQVRVPGNTYVFGDNSLTNSSGETEARMSISFDSGHDAGLDETENIVGGEATYWLDLDTPLAGPFIYNVLTAAGHTTHIEDGTGICRVEIRQNALIPKIWPK